jgi:hypothetical protein
VVRTRPADLDDRALCDALRSGWRIDVAALRYETVGFGSHHWTVTDRARRRWFVTVGDLANNGMAGRQTTDSTFARLAGAFSTALALHVDAALPFVVAPVVRHDGATLERIGDRWSLVVHEHLDAHVLGDHGEFSTADDRARVADLVTRVHNATGTVRPAVPYDDGSVPERDALDRAIDALGDEWDTGPYGPRARHLLAAHARDVEHLFGSYDRLANRVRSRPERFVVTHGEPHAGNWLVAGDDLLLVDWDTTALAPPERDLWQIDPGDGSIVARYEARTGRAADREALSCYRLWWDVAEIALYVARFHTPHDDDADSAQSWENLRFFLRPRTRWPELFDS